MKHLLHLAAISLLFAALACEKQPNQKSGDDNVITLNASAQTIAMNDKTQSNEAVKFTWNAASNKGTGARITYSMLFDLEGNEFASPYEIELGTNVLEKAFTGLELNNILTEQFGKAVDEEVSIEVCIYATINDPSVDDVISNAVKLNVKVFAPALEVLYMIGSATAAGWDIAAAVPMDRIAAEEGGFTWNGELSAGELKFVTTTADFFPCYVRDEADSTKMVYRTVDLEEVVPDLKWNFGEGNYKIDVNIESLTIKITQLEGPEYFTMSLTGDLFAEPQTLLRSGYVFFWGGEFTQAGANTFSFIQNADGTGAHFGAAVENAAYTEQGVSLSSDFSWQLKNEECGKSYKINLYTKKGKEVMYCREFTPYENIYLIGDSCDQGWDISDDTKRVPMNKVDAYTFTWTGSLKAGELKFSCDCQSDWYGAWFLAPKDNTIPSGEVEKVYFLDKSDATIVKMGIKEFDRKWRIEEGAEGVYQITLNQKDDTVIIKKQ